MLHEYHNHYNLNTFMYCQRQSDENNHILENREDPSDWQHNIKMKVYKY